MKKYIIPFVVIMLIAASCKKNKPGNRPPSQPPTAPPPVSPPAPAGEKKWVVTTVAGNGTASFVNGPVLSATFHFPVDVAVAPDGTMYVTDILNFCLRKIAAGQVSTFAGGSGFDIINGNGLSAQFKNPYSVALDANGNLYTSDDNDPRIRKTSQAKDVSTYAGTATEGFADGDAGTARFFPGSYNVADAHGNIYISDARNNRIRMVSVNGEVSTVAGSSVSGFNDGNAGSAKFSFPAGIALDKQGSLYVADRFNFRIRKITREGVVSTIAGSGVQGDRDGTAGEAQFSLDIRDIVVDEPGNLYLSDGNRIRKITPQGVVSTIAGSTAGFADGDGSSAKFNFPNGLTIDAQGNIYVADLSNNRIRKISFE